MTYYFTYTTLLLLRLLDTGRREKALYWIAFFGLFLFSALRLEVGCDWPNYLINYQVQGWRGYAEAFQQSNPSHWILLETLHQFGLGYQWLNIVTSAIFFAGLNALAWRSPAPIAVLALAFPVLILNMPMAAVKQAAAIGLMCFAINAFIDQRPGRFIAWVFVAATFHTSAMVFILLLPFIKGKFTTRNIVFGVLLALPGGIFILGTDAAEVASERYIDSNIEAGGAIFRVGFVAATGIYYTVFLNKRWKAVSPHDHAFFSLAALGMIGLGALLPISSVIADRFGYYFMLPQVFIFSALPWLSRKGGGKFTELLPYAATSVLFIAWTLMSTHYLRCYSPYSMGFLN